MSAIVAARRRHAFRASRRCRSIRGCWRSRWWWRRSARCVFGLMPAMRAARTQPGDVLRDQSRSATGGGAQHATARMAGGVAGGAGVRAARGRRAAAGELPADPPARSGRQAGRRAHIRAEPAGGALRFDRRARNSTKRLRAARGASRRARGRRDVQAARDRPVPFVGREGADGPLARTKSAAAPAPSNRVVSGDYFRAAGIPLVEGRVFDATRRCVGAPDRVVVSRSFATAMYPGHQRRWASDSAPAGAPAKSSASSAMSPIDNEGGTAQYVYHAHRQFAGDRNWALTQFVATSGDPAAARTVDPPPRWPRVDPQLVMFRPTTFDDSHRPRRRAARLHAARS